MVKVFLSLSLLLIIFSTILIKLYFLYYWSIIYRFVCCWTWLVDHSPGKSSLFSFFPLVTIFISRQLIFTCTAFLLSARKKKLTKRVIIESQYRVMSSKPEKYQGSGVIFIIWSFEKISGFFSWKTSFSTLWKSLFNLFLNLKLWFLQYWEKIVISPLYTAEMRV